MTDAPRRANKRLQKTRRRRAKGRPSMRLWKLLREREVFSATPWFSVKKQVVQLPDGRVVTIPRANVEIIEN